MRPSIRDWAIGGVFGGWVQVTDGARKYARAPAGDLFPLSMWSNRWSTMPSNTLPCDAAGDYVLLYSERIRVFEENPPPADWNGVFVLETK